jgi:hypothetical protein
MVVGLRGLFRRGQVFFAVGQIRAQGQCGNAERAGGAARLLNLQRLAIDEVAKVPVIAPEFKEGVKIALHRAHPRGMLAATGLLQRNGLQNKERGVSRHAHVLVHGNPGVALIPLAAAVI